MTSSSSRELDRAKHEDIETVQTPERVLQLSFTCVKLSEMPKIPAKIQYDFCSARQSI